MARVSRSRCSSDGRSSAGAGEGAGRGAVPPAAVPGAAPLGAGGYGLLERAADQQQKGRNRAYRHVTHRVILREPAIPGSISSQALQRPVGRAADRPNGGFPRARRSTTPAPAILRARIRGVRKKTDAVVSKQDTHFFNVFSLVIGLLVAVAVGLFALARIVASHTQDLQVL